MVNGDALLRAEAGDVALGDLALVALGDHEVRVGEGGDGGQVGDAEDLVVAGHVGDGAADLVGDGAAHAGVDLVEDIETGRPALG